MNKNIQTLSKNTPSNAPTLMQNLRDIIKIIAPWCKKNQKIVITSIPILGFAKQIMALLLAGGLGGLVHFSRGFVIVETIRFILFLIPIPLIIVLIFSCYDFIQNKIKRLSKNDLFFQHSYSIIAIIITLIVLWSGFWIHVILKVGHLPNMENWQFFFKVLITLSIFVAPSYYLLNWFKDVYWKALDYLPKRMPTKLEIGVYVGTILFVAFCILTFLAHDITGKYYSPKNMEYLICKEQKALPNKKIEYDYTNGKVVFLNVENDKPIVRGIAELENVTFCE